MKKSSQLSLTQKAMQALTNAVAKVVDEHRWRARPLAVWRDGKSVWISPTEAAALRKSTTPHRMREKTGSTIKAER